MSDKHDDEADERDSQPGEDRDSDAPSEREPAPKKKKAAASTKPARTSPPAPARGIPGPRVGLFVVLALAAGGAAGWFGQIQQAKAAAVRADQAAPVGSNAGESGTCGAWQAKICASTGKQSAACQQAKDAAELLTPSTCTAALDAVPATLSRLKVARASCDQLVSKLCADLPPGSETCTMVKERTPNFPPQRCSEMINHYDEVLEPLKMLDQQGGPRLGGGHGAAPAPGPVMPPH